MPLRRRSVVLLGSILLLWNLWGWDLWAPDEPYFGEGAREMIADGQWLVPHVNGVITTDKPPLFFWLIALFSLPFGHVTSLTARLPSALAAVCSLAMTMRLGGRFGGERTGTVGGLVLATTFLFWSKGRTAQIDSLLCCLILVSLSAFEAFRAGEARGARAGLLFWTAAALAVVAKGPVGFLLPLGIALVTLAFDRDLSAWRRFAPVRGPALFAGLVGAWAVAATIGGGGEYSVWQAVEKHVLERAVEGMHHAQPPWYYLGVLPVQLLPWSALVPGALLLAWRRRGDPRDRFLLVWALFVVAFFSASTEKRDLYVLPATPAFALMVTRLLDRLQQTDGAAERAGAHAHAYRRWATWSMVFTGCLVVLAGAALPFAAARSGTIPLVATLPAAVSLLATGAATLWLSSRRPFRSTLVLGGGVALTYLLSVTTLYPAFEPLKSARPFAVRVEQATEASRRAGNTVLAFRIGNLTDAISFYTGGMYTEEASLETFRERMEGDAPVFAIADADEIRALPADLRERIEIVDRARFSSIRVVLVRSRAGAPGDGTRGPSV